MIKVNMTFLEMAESIAIKYKVNANCREIKKKMIFDFYSIVHV